MCHILTRGPGLEHGPLLSGAGRGGTARSGGRGWGQPAGLPWRSNGGQHAEDTSWHRDGAARVDGGGKGTGARFGHRRRGEGDGRGIADVDHLSGTRRT